jgi:GT2 family glycosyltransferase
MCAKDCTKNIVVAGGQMKANNPRVSIIILNWNGWKDTLECMESLRRIDYPSYDIIILDNGSKDDSIQKIKDYLAGSIAVEAKFLSYSLDNKPIRLLELSKSEADCAIAKDNGSANLPFERKLILIKNDKNYGFAEGNNIGIRYSMRVLIPDYILLLNNDTVVDKAFLRELVDVAESDSAIGFAGPKVFYYNFQGRTDIISVAGIDLIMNKGHYHRIGELEIDAGQYEEVRVVDFIEGSCLLARSRTLQEVGLFNPRYFAYWEETDLCARGAEAGYKSIFVPKSRIWHKIGSSAPSTMRLYYMTRNRLWFMRQHANSRDLISFSAYFFTFYLIGMTRRLILKGDIESLKLFLMGVVDGVLRRV